MNFLCLDQDFSFEPNHNFDLSKKQREIIPLHEKDKTVLLKEYFKILSNGNIPFIINPSIPSDIAKSMFPEQTSIERVLGHIICTSGTTSAKPKTFFFELSKIQSNALAHNESLGLKPASQILFPLPFHHSFGVTVGFWGTLMNKGVLKFTCQSMGAGDILKNLGGVDILYLTPPQVRQLIKYANRFSGTIVSPHKISIGSSILFENEAYELQNIFPTSELYYTYGLTEMGPRVSTYKITGPKNERRNLPLGEPLKGVQFEVREQVLHIQSPYACSMVENPFNTHDLIKDGLIVGRNDDTIIYQGRNIFPQEIETLLSPFGECVLIGIDSKLHGEIPVLVFQEKPDEEKIWTFLKNHLPESHLPKRIILGENIPKTNMNKIKRNELKKRIKL